MATLALASICASAGVRATSPQSSRTIPVRNGTVVVTREDDVDHVVTKSAAGDIVAESWCVVSDGSYDEFARLFSRLVAAVGSHDVNTVASLMQYPLTVNAARARTVKTEAEFKTGFDRIFTPRVAQALSETQVEDVFCKNGTAMIAHGTVWASKEKNRVGIFVVNQ